jgi:seryl-tRNA synthetase
MRDMRDQEYWQDAFGAVRWLAPQSEDTMAKKSKLTQVAVKIGAAMGRADRKAHQIANAGVLAKKELADISRQVDALKRQLQKTTKRLKRALS